MLRLYSTADDKKCIAAYSLIIFKFSNMYIVAWGGYDTFCGLGCRYVGALFGGTVAQSFGYNFTEQITHQNLNKNAAE